MARSDGDFCFLLHPSGILTRALGKCSSEPKACDSQAAHSDVAFDPSIDTGGVMLLASITPSVISVFTSVTTFGSSSTYSNENLEDFSGEGVSSIFNRDP